MTAQGLSASLVRKVCVCVELNWWFKATASNLSSERDIFICLSCDFITVNHRHTTVCIYASVMFSPCNLIYLCHVAVCCLNLRLSCIISETRVSPSRGSRRDRHQTDEITCTGPKVTTQILWCVVSLVSFLITPNTRHCGLWMKLFRVVRKSTWHFFCSWPTGLKYLARRSRAMMVLYDRQSGFGQYLVSDGIKDRRGSERGAAEWLNGMKDIG